MNKCPFKVGDCVTPSLLVLPSFKEPDIKEVSIVEDIRRSMSIFNEYEIKINGNWNSFIFWRHATVKEVARWKLRLTNSKKDDTI